MVADALNLLTLMGFTILLGYIGMIIFEKTRIPDVIWLLLFGLLVGPVFGITDRNLFLGMVPLLSAVALIIILFEAGLNMNFYQMLREFPRSTVLAVFGVLTSMIGAAFLSNILFGFGFFEGLLLGAIIGGTSSPIVLSIVSMLKGLRGDMKTMLELESILTDPLCIVISITLIQIIVSSISISEAAHNLVSAYSIGAVVGIIFGFIWLFILDKLKGRPFDYMITLAVIFLTYVFVEIISGSGAIAALLFGVVLGNGKIFSEILQFKKVLGVEPSLKNFQKEISFFIRSFFFVFIGLIATINYTYAIYGIIIAILLIIMRVFVAQIAIYEMGLGPSERNIVKTMTPRGLAAAVLAGLPITYGIAHGDIYLNVAFIVIFATVVYTSIATRIFYKPPEDNTEENNKKVKNNNKKPNKK